MKTLSEIRRDIVSFYSSIQNRVTDFSFGSVISGIFYSVSAVAEQIYSEIRRVENQAYISTATGRYLDKLIDGTFQIQRTPATRSFGYVTIYADSPLPNDVTLTYATLDENQQNFTSPTADASKFLASASEGEESIVYVLQEPTTTSSTQVDTENRTITIPAGVQYAILPVVSVQTGSQVRIREGDLSVFPESPSGISGVLNTLNPGLIFSTNEEYTGTTPFTARFTTFRSYNAGTLNVDNAFTFSNSGLIEVNEDIFSNPISAVYKNSSGETLSAGLIFEYIDSTLGTITLKNPFADNVLPTITSVNSDGQEDVYTLESFTYTASDSSVVSSDVSDDGTTTFFNTIETLFTTYQDVLIIKERRKTLVESLIFDLDKQLLSDNTLLSSAAVSGATDADSDEEYRQTITTYLGSLGRGTNTALVSGALQVSGITFAKVLPSYLTPPGSSTVVASDVDGFLSSSKRVEVKNFLENDWKASGIRLNVQGPNRIPIHVSVSVKSDNGSENPRITSDILTETAKYFDSLSVGQKISYSDLLARYNTINNVDNVFNLVITKQLTDETYQTYKNAYDEELIIGFTKGSRYLIQEYNTNTDVENPSPNQIIYNSGVSSYQVYYEESWENIADVFTDANNIGKVLVLNTSGASVTSEAVTLSTYQNNQSDYEVLGILYKDDNFGEFFVVPASELTNAYSLYNEVRVNSVTTTKQLEDILNSYFTNFNGSPGKFNYLASYILSESIDPTTLSDYPVNPSTVKSENIQDYDAGEFDIYRMDTFLFQGFGRVAVGVNHLTPCSDSEGNIVPCSDT